MDRKDGANAVIRRGSSILVIRHRYGNPEHSFALPGGSQEENETPEEAMIREVKEETGLIVRKSLHIGKFIQRYRVADGGGTGLLHLFEVNGAQSEEPLVYPNDEVEWARYMSFKEICENRENFGLSYFRLILQYMRCLDGIDTIPFTGKLSDQVRYEPWGLEDKNIVLRV